MKEDELPELSNGLLTEPMDVHSDEFIAFQAIVLNEARNQSEEQKRKVELMSLKIMMEDYISSDNDKEIKSIGEFLKAHLKVLKVQQKKFAEYVGLKPSNLSKLLSGERPINIEMALILSKLFSQDPMLWLKVQTKNQLSAYVKSEGRDLNQFSLQGLLEQK